MGIAEHHHVKRLPETDNVETMLVWSLHQAVISVNKLDKLSPCIVNAAITCSRKAAVGLTHIDDAVGICTDFVDYGLVRAVVNDYYLIFIPTQRQGENAHEALFKKRCRKIVGSHYETDVNFVIHRTAHKVTKTIVFTRFLLGNYLMLCFFTNRLKAVRWNISSALIILSTFPAGSTLQNFS